MKAFEPQFEWLVDELIDGFVERGEADGLHDLAMPMAIAFSIAAVAGRRSGNEHDQTLGQRLSVAVQSHEHPRADGRAAHELCEMQNYLIALVRRRMANPKTTCSPTSSAPVRRTRNPSASRSWWQRPGRF